MILLDAMFMIYDLNLDTQNCYVNALFCPEGNLNICFVFR